MVGLFKILNAEFGKSNDSIGDKLLFLNQKKKNFNKWYESFGKKEQKNVGGGGAATNCCCYNGGIGDKLLNWDD